MSTKQVTDVGKVTFEVIRNKLSASPRSLPSP